MAASRRIGAAFASGIVALSLALSPAAHAANWEDTTIKPGETISLVRADDADDSAQSATHTSAKVANSSTLPAGWSVWSQNGTFRVAASAKAQPGETAYLTLVNNCEVIDEVKVTVEGSTENTRSASASSEISWIDGFFISLNRIFS
ncbi:hypothetical protein [Corynebacterium lubricantis]|uniref:hypothetical protein n=1 Tax=Corynebacterium lubricantis TaxID=541095 RepID=UPI0003607AE1|nr:hypothetical protein [Corynebacterium lubricantis]